MHVPTLITLALTASLASAASYLTMIERFEGGLTWGGNTWQGVWHTAAGDNFAVDFPNGCYPPGIGGVFEICMDHKKKRAHFFAMGQKRCFAVWKEVFVGSCMKGGCTISRWNEVGCSW